MNGGKQSAVELAGPVPCPQQKPQVFSNHMTVVADTCPTSQMAVTSFGSTAAYRFMRW